MNSDKLIINAAIMVVDADSKAPQREQTLLSASHTIPLRSVAGR